MHKMTHPTAKQTNHDNTHPMVAFEHYMYADDRPTHSMVVQMRFWFRGHFQKDIFLAALKETLTRNRMFQMKLSGKPGARTSNINWVEEPSLVMPFISWTSLDDPVSHPKNPTHIDLTNEIGLRLWVRDNNKTIPDVDNTKSELLVQFHHSVCDGVGMLLFIEELLIHYAHLTGITHHTLRPIDPNLFSSRGNFWLTKSEWKNRFFKDFQRAFNYFKFLAQPLAHPPAQTGELTSHADLFASERHVFSAETMKNIRQTARSIQATVNDVLLYELFHTLSIWNKSLGRIRNKIRVALATSLRIEQDTKQSCLNIVSMVFLHKSHKDVSSKNLLAGIVAETRDVKQNRMGITLPRFMGWCGKIPLAIKIFMDLPYCSATAVLTNLGATLSNSSLVDESGKLTVGPIRLEGYELLPPVRPRTSASFAINYYAGQLSVSLRFDSTRLTRATAISLLERYCQRLKQVAETKSLTGL
jgi:NRPS condensation-like uncharacterized protein